MSDPAVVQQYKPQQQTITMTPAALAHLERQIEKQGHGMGMRLGLEKRGCSGLAYTVEVIDQVNKGDHVYEIGHDKIIAISPKNLPLLQGTQIDFVKEGLNQHFSFKNPNEKGSCGCGESFSV